MQPDYAHKREHTVLAGGEEDSYMYLILLKFLLLKPDT